MEPGKWQTCEHGRREQRSVERRAESVRQPFGMASARRRPRARRKIAARPMALGGRGRVVPPAAPISHDGTRIRVMQARRKLLPPRIRLGCCNDPVCPRRAYSSYSTGHRRTRSSEMTWAELRAQSNSRGSTRSSYFAAAAHLQSIEVATLTPLTAHERRAPRASCHRATRTRRDAAFALRPQGSACRA